MNFDLRIFLYNKLQKKIFSNKGLRQVQQDTSRQGLPPALALVQSNLSRESQLIEEIKRKHR
jgi:hypothetical protein